MAFMLGDVVMVLLRITSSEIDPKLMMGVLVSVITEFIAFAVSIVDGPIIPETSNQR